MGNNKPPTTTSAMIYKKLCDPVFDVEIHMVADCSHKEMKAFLYRKFNLHYTADSIVDSTVALNAECLCIIGKTGYRNYACWFKVFDIKQAETLYDIVHEASHLVDRIFKDRNIGHDTEVKAYYLEYLVREIWRWCSKTTRPAEGQPEVLRKDG